MGINLDVLPCPFCGNQLKHIGSWAKSFDPPRLYHEWLHPPVVCQINFHGGEVPILSATDNADMQIAVLERWNTRAVASPNGDRA